jgi:hypothetical protein
MILTPKDLIPVDSTLKGYTQDPNGLDWPRLLALFVPPLPQAGEIIVLSHFGDLFISQPDGSVLWLNPQMGRIDTVARTREAFIERLNTDYVAMLKTPLVEQMIRLDRLLKAGMFYGLMQLPRDGGRWHPDNIGAAPAADAFAFWGAEFRKANPNPQIGSIVRDGPAPPANTLPPLELPKLDPKPKKKGWF